MDDRATDWRNRARRSHPIRLLLPVSSCPENGKDAARIRMVAIYYRSLRILYGLSHPLIPMISSWAKREQQACSHFAAVILDRRISSSRDLFLQHGANRP